MAQKLTSQMADNLEIGAGWQVQFNAVDPVTGANIGSVNVANVVIMVENIATGDEAALTVAELTPIWVPLASDQVNPGG